IDIAEALNGDTQAVVEAIPGQVTVDFGSVAPDEYGVPRLNNAIRIWYLDKEGNAVTRATGLHDERVAGFNFAVQPFGWGRGYSEHADGRRARQGGEASTLREIFTT